MGVQLGFLLIEVVVCLVQVGAEVLDGVRAAGLELYRACVVASST